LLKKIIFISVIINLVLAQSISLKKVYEIDSFEEKFFCRIKSIKSDDNFIYIADFSGYSIYKFSREGNYVNSKGRRGAGPGEFNSGCVDLISSDGKIYVRDLNGVTVFHEFDNNFNYIKTHKPASFIREFAPFKNGFFAFTESRESINLNILDKNFNIISNVIQKNKDEELIFNKVLIETDNTNKIILCYPLRNLIQIYSPSLELIQEIKIDYIQEKADIEIIPGYERFTKDFSLKKSKYLHSYWLNYVYYAALPDFKKNIFIQAGNKSKKYEGDIFIYNLDGKLKQRIDFDKNQIVEHISTDSLLFTVNKDKTSFSCYKIIYE